MPFCSWCQLESETEGACAWCKRPFQRYTQSGFDYLREEEPVGDRLVPVIGGLVVIGFLGMVIYGVSNRDSSTTAANQLTPVGNLTGSISTPPGPAAPAIAALTSPPAAAPTPPPPRVYQPASQPLPPRDSATSQANTVWEGGEVALGPLSVGRASLSVARNSAGDYVCHGSIAIAIKDSLPLYNLRVLLISDGNPVVMRAYTGDPASPNVYEAVVLQPGETTIRVIADGVSPTLLKARLPKVTISGNIGGEQVTASLPLEG